MKPYLLLLVCFINWAMDELKPVAVSQPSFTTENIEFNNAGVTLSGTIFTPQKPYAAIVLVHGSGQEARMTEFASLLARNGITVLTYDKRGVGKSGGIYAGPEVGTNNVDSANLNLLAADAGAASKALLARLPAKHGPLGLMGGSQAGWIIPLAADKNGDVKFMVLFSGPIATTLEQLRFQFHTNGNSNYWETHTEAEARQHIQDDPDRYQFKATDPRETLNKLSISGLWLFGGKDIQTPVGLSTERLDVLKFKGKKYEFMVFPELGHNTAFAKTQEPFNAAIRWIKSLKK